MPRIGVPGEGQRETRKRSTNWRTRDLWCRKWQGDFLYLRFEEILLAFEAKNPSVEWYMQPFRMQSSEMVHLFWGKKKKRATTQILLGKEMGTHSSILAWRILWTKEPGRLQSMRSQESRHDLATKPPPPPPISLNHFFQESWLNLIQQGTRTCAINIRHEWNCSLLSISYCWKFFHSTISHLLQSGTLLACSLVASPCVSAVILYYCTFQGTAL